MKIDVVPCLADNYCYIASDEASRRAVIIDPSEAMPVLEAITRLEVQPLAVLCTHHHADHVSGIAGLLERFPKLRIFGHPYDADRLGVLTDVVPHEQRVAVEGLSALALHVPGHTRGAIAWVMDGCAFTGDTLFVAGCGKLFEGSPQQMYTSLNEVIGALPDETRVYCGHEYTVSNLRFALRVEPGNAACARRLDAAVVRSFASEPTVPSTLGEERTINPFLRCTQPAVVETARREGCKQLDPISVFAWVRRAKDNFRPSVADIATRKM